MATTLKQTEAAPASYPSTDGLALSTAATALDAAIIWQRIEAYTAYRWTVRNVVWIVEGPGEWTPPLMPVTVSTVEEWTGTNEWSETTLSASPMGGYFLRGTGPYRLTGTAGGGDLPEDAKEAFRRLVEYIAAKPGKAGASSESIAAGSINIAYRRDSAWLADAMRNSGAGDLLRRYRRAA